jgi:septum formation protein
MSAKTTENRPRPLVLASTSRYRRELLARLGLPFDVEAPGVDETPLRGEPPAATAGRLAEAKARAVAARRGDALVIGADQVADAGGLVFSKPADHADAVAQLTRLAGKSVVFHTAIALVDAASGRCAARLIDVTTTFRPLEQGAIEAYLRRERPYDCAASIKSEGLGIALVESIRSDDPTALIGLPLIALVDLLRAEGVDVWTDGTAQGSAAAGPVAE